MGLFDIFRRSRKRNTANLARDRLQIMIAHEHARRDGAPNYLPKMRDEIIEVIRKYVSVNDDGVNVNIEKGNDYDVLELNIALPERK